MRYIIRLAVLFVISFGLVACMGSTVSKSNFERIEIGMTDTKVNDIMGEPNRTKAAGVTALGVEAYWEGDKATIKVQFVDRLVYRKEWIDK
ncbi:hypothetical protein [Beggiatoa leptomitoformis]|uniref:DUF3862 domain-containing protein n=1 Tax=Beggiatoa leptomitoformis TaxID=288004 RepID=A0A2N9YDZ4_9GAMM|nr:hypothetical protein [Beggiatoa leptomitoformis]ALG68912.1 hypothetical protein AL038_15925 [Beggiatoa leptomitoformis]AUI68711.1 hypothetical protein BLE401_08335 [Beggiatoa leptomitoformis]